jgi:positive regulator of sigma E activity
MQNAAMWLASIFGPLLVILGLWKLLYSDTVEKVLHSVKNSPGLIYFSSVIYLWIGLTVLSQYDLWGMNSLMLVTLLGWVMVARGILGLFVPQMLFDMYFKNEHYMKLCGIVPLIWGIILCWVGFFM